MRLSKLEIKNFRRIESAEIHFSPATFIIGSNNYGKSSIIKCIEAILSLKEVIKLDDFRIQPDETRADMIELSAHFSNIDHEVANSRGFKGRVVNGEYFYKKEFSLNVPNKPKIFTKQYSYKISDEYSTVANWDDLVAKGHSEKELFELFNIASVPKGKKLPNSWELCIDGAVEWDFTSTPDMVENPGGIPSNVVSKLPRVVHIPSYTDVNDIGKAENNTTTMGECLNILFEDLLNGNEIAATIQGQLDELQEMMSPATKDSMTQVLCREVNKVIDEVFPECGIEISPSLKELTNVLKPQYTVSLYSNVNTDPGRQGTGLVRTAIFSMLRYHSSLKSKADYNARPLLVAFEEPELYLHPSAANLLRDTIYSLGLTDQIVCTTHSPWMIDLSRDWQSLTKICLKDDYAYATNYGLDEASSKLEGDEKTWLNMIKTFDDELSRVFFAEKCLIVEGDSEIVAIRNSLKHLDPETRKRIHSTVQIIRARGKAAIIPLVKYLNALKVPVSVIHDRDQGKEGAEKFNKPIAEIVGDPERVWALEECLEQCLGYEPPTSEKPFRVYVETSQWKKWDDAPKPWRDVLSKALDI